MRVGIMGGTFDPVHHGHLVAAECAREGADLDEVWFMPCNVPPHKKDAPGANTRQRWDMVCLAVRDHPAFRPVDLEIRRGGVSYSYDTVRMLKARHPDVHFCYIIGADMVQYLPHWHRIDELAQLVSFIGLKRPGTDIRWGDLSETIRSRIIMVDMPLLDISSTLVRERRRAGRSVRYLVPEEVRKYMEVAGLYE